MKLVNGGQCLAIVKFTPQNVDEWITFTLKKDLYRTMFHLGKYLMSLLIYFYCSLNSQKVYWDIPVKYVVYFTQMCLCYAFWWVKFIII